MAMKDIEVRETIKEGKTIYKAKSSWGEGSESTHAHVNPQRCGCSRRSALWPTPQRCGT
jgi:hypothetical protein